MTSPKKVALIIANEGFEQTEYHTPKKIIEQAGFTVVTVSNKLSPAIAKDGSTVPVSLLTEQVNPEEFAGIFFIGGPGTLENLDNQESYILLNKIIAAGIPFGAICHATRVLAHANALTGKRATGYDGDRKLSSIYKEHKIEYIHQPIVIDDNIITATDPSAAQEFANAIVKLVKAHSD